METSVNVILNKAAEKIGFDRVRYNEKNIPTTISNISSLIFLGDIQNEFFCSSLALKRIKEELYGSKYFILLSWPGHKELYPYVDEYWQPKNEESLKNIYLNINDNYINSIKRYLNSYLPEDVLDLNIFDKYYKNGFQKEFFNRFSYIKMFLPSIPSLTILGSEVSKRVLDKSRKIFIYPSTHIQVYKNGKIENINVFKDLWSYLIEYLLQNGYNPIIYQNFLTYDMSSEFYDKCFIYQSSDLINVLSLMRSCDFVVDIFTGIYKYAIMSRTPFISVLDRSKFISLKEYEIDDLCSKDLPKEYIYLFSDICDIKNKEVWKKTLFQSIINKIESMSNISKDEIPAPIEVYKELLYSNVRNINNKKLGTKFIKVEKF